MDNFQLEVRWNNLGLKPGDLIIWKDTFGKNWLYLVIDNDHIFRLDIGHEQCYGKARRLLANYASKMDVTTIVRG